MYYNIYDISKIWIYLYMKRERNTIMIKPSIVPCLFTRSKYAKDSVHDEVESESFLTILHPLEATDRALAVEAVNELGLDAADTNVTTSLAGVMAIYAKDFIAYVQELTLEEFENYSEGLDYEQ